MFASAGLLVAASVPLAHEAVTGVVTAAIVLGSVLLMIFRRADALWIVAGAAATALAAAVLHVRNL